MKLNIGRKNLPDLSILLQSKRKIDWFIKLTIIQGKTFTEWFIKMTTLNQKKRLLGLSNRTL